MSEKLIIERTIKAKAETLFDAWLDPQGLKAWFMPGEGVTIPSPVIDASVGGKFDFTMDVAGDLLPHTGEYQIIDRPNTLQFTWVSMGTENKETLVTIHFKKLSENETLITLTHELFPNDESKERHNGGWSRILETFKQTIHS